VILLPVLEDLFSLGYRFSRGLPESSVNQRSYVEPENWNAKTADEIKRQGLVYVCVGSQLRNSAPDEKHRQVGQKHEFGAVGRPAIHN